MNPETLPRHELVGLPVRVVDATNPDVVGIEGTVVSETTNTLVIGTDGAGVAASGTRQVPKATATFEFELPDGQFVTVEGERLVSRPARRTELTGDSIWR